MSLKTQYNIDDVTWQKLWRIFKIILFWCPLTGSVLVGGTWAVTEDTTWVPANFLLWFVPYLLIIFFSRVWLVRSKFTILTLLIMISLFELLFVVISVSCIYVFYGTYGFWIQNFLLLIVGGFVCVYYYAYWDRVWLSHEAHNETVVLDLENGRYDFLNNFDMSEDKLNKSKTQKYSNPVLINIAFTVAPIGASIPLIFSKFGDHSIPLVIMWALSVPFSLYFLKIVMAHFYTFKKINSYEKKSVSQLLMA